MILADEMAKLPEPPNDSHPPLWDYWRHDLWSRAQSEPAQNFMRWPAVYHTMLQDHWPDVVEQEAKRLPIALADRLWKYAGQDADQGSSFRNLIHQTYHLWRWEEATGKRVADLFSICEFGGGYGAMALACSLLGFTGDYYIIDLPEFGLLQKWYLQQHGLERVILRTKAWPLDLSLLIACYSMSEIPLEYRDQLAQVFHPDSYLLLYSNRFEEYDNLAYFQDADRLTAGAGGGYTWRHERIEHMPPESWYTWGW